MEYLERRLSSLKPSHVYISFRGDEEDEGARRFIRSLSAALKAQGLTIFGCHSNLHEHNLYEAMDKSWVWIIVFSKNYASSWCLKELARFAGCGDFWAVPQGAVMYYRGERMGENETRVEAEIEKVNKWMRALHNGPHHPSGGSSVGDRIIPIYYDVDQQSIAQHAYPPPANPFDDDYTLNPTNLQSIAQRIQQVKIERQRKRRQAVLRLISSSPPACHLSNYSSGSQVIPKIVKQVKTKIDKHFYDLFGFVGIQSQVEEAEKLLELSRDGEVRVVGICGMSGLGKPSIATVLYLKIFHNFDAFCFLPNVSARLKQGDISLHELLHRHLETENEAVWNFLDEEFLACKRLINHKFLIVLDGVDLAQHLQELNLVDISDCFGMGSRIIITTRDEQVLQEYDIDTVYRPKLLSKEEASKLFCSKAFPKEYPTEDFKEMIDRILEYADGLPLALEKLGSSLFGKGIAEWRSFLGREEIIPPVEIITVLRKSYDELDDMSKEMFLDIACFFVGKDISCVKEVLQDCFSCDVDIEFKLLIQKSIITIANQKIQMHGIYVASNGKRNCSRTKSKSSR